MVGIAGKPRLDVDWIMLEGEYRAGLLPVKQLARLYDVEETSIRYRAKRYGWTRNVKEKIKKRTQEINAEKNAEQCQGLDGEQALTYRQHFNQHLDSPYDEDALVEAVAQHQAEIIEQSKRRIHKLQTTVESMFEELARQSLSTEQLQGLAEMVALAETQEDLYADPARVQKLVNGFKKTLALGNRADIAKKLADSLKVLIGLERQAHGISDNANGDGDTPEIPVDSMSTNEAARRVAFLLTKASLTKETAK